MSLSLPFVVYCPNCVVRDTINLPDEVMPWVHSNILERDPSSDHGKILVLWVLLRLGSRLLLVPLDITFVFVRTSILMSLMMIPWFSMLSWTTWTGPRFP